MENISIKQRGKKGNNWQGGKVNIKKHIKKGLLEWKKLSMQNCNYKCIISGERFDDIHHLYPFNLIFDEALYALNIDYKNKTGDYSEDELNKIIFLIEDLHKKHPLGVCLKKEIHREFHRRYGNNNFTPDDFYKFQKNYNFVN
jgi:hypothetical protein